MLALHFFSESALPSWPHFSDGVQPCYYLQKLIFFLCTGMFPHDRRPSHGSPTIPSHPMHHRPVRHRGPGGTVTDGSPQGESSDTLFRAIRDCRAAGCRAAGGGGGINGDKLFCSVIAPLFPKNSKGLIRICLFKNIFIFLVVFPPRECPVTWV